MADNKLTGLQEETTPVGDDLFLIVVNTDGVPVSKRIKIRTFLSNIPSNTSITGNLSVSNTINSLLIETDDLTVSGDGIIVTGSLTAANSSQPSIPTGKVFYDDNYLYVKVNDDEVKRVALSTF